MIIVNTTFVIHRGIEDQILDWVKNKYLASAAKLSADEFKPLLTKVLSTPDPDSATYAIHIYFDNMDSARRWNEGVGESMRRIIAERWGERVLTFHTYLEVMQSSKNNLVEFGK